MCIKSNKISEKSKNLQTIWLKNGQRDRSKHFAKEKYKWLTCTWKCMQHENHQGNANQNHPEIAPLQSLLLPLTCVPVFLFFSGLIHRITVCPCLVAQLCLALCNPKDCSLTGSSVHRILQARILEWVTIPFFRVSSWLRNWTWVSCIAGRFFTTWATREAHFQAKTWIK